MAYNNYFPNGGYQQFYPQYQQPMMQQPVQQPAQNVQPHENGIIWVQGEAAARAYLTPAGKSVLLMDSESNTFYLKSTDVSGMPQPLRIFDYTERTAQTQGNQIIETQAKEIDTSQFVTREELEERLAKLKPATRPKGVKNEQSDL